MSSARSRQTSISRPQSTLAWLLAALIFALGLLAASPATHAHLHASPDSEQGTHDHAVPHATDDSGCAVVLFAQGVSLPLDLPGVSAPRALVLTEFALVSRDELLLTPPRHLHQPGRGPPCIG